VAHSRGAVKIRLSFRISLAIFVTAILVLFAAVG
jgi:hypothetical protein